MKRVNRICAECQDMDMARWWRWDKPMGYIEIELCPSHAKTFSPNPELREQNRRVEQQHGAQRAPTRKSTRRAKPF